MIFLVQFGNKQALVNLFKDHKLHKPYGLAQFCWSLKKINSCSFVPSCTRNHVFTYTNNANDVILRDHEYSMKFE